MLQLFYRIYYLKFTFPWLDHLFTRIIIRTSNIVLPLIFNITAWSPKNRLQKKTVANDINVIVSLTTYTARIDKVWMVIESVLRQRMKPDMVMLWLSKDEFPDKLMLPKNLLALEKRGLQIRFCTGNLQPHKKYFYAMQEFPQAIIITMDDDVLYPPDLVKKLIQTNKRFPASICSAITRQIKTFNGKFLPYNYWEYVKTNTASSFDLLPIGAGGTLFPPNALSAEVFNEKQLKQMALRTDDLWLKVMSLLNKTKVVSIAGEYSRFLIPVIQKNKGGLMDTNIGQFQNDKDFNQLMSHYQIPISIFESA